MKSTDWSLAALALEEKGRPSQPLTTILDSDRKIHEFLDSFGEAYGKTFQAGLSRATASFRQDSEQQVEEYRARIKELLLKKVGEEAEKRQDRELAEQNELLKKDQLHLLKRLSASKELLRQQKLEIAELQHSQRFYRDKCKSLLRSQCSGESSSASLFPTLPPQPARKAPARRNRFLFLRHY